MRRYRGWVLYFRRGRKEAGKILFLFFCSCIRGLFDGIDLATKCGSFFKDRVENL